MIKVIIDRQVADDLLSYYKAASLRTLQSAMQSKGFISGESLEDLNDPNHQIVIASYRTAADWFHWLNSNERKLMMETLAPLLMQEERVTLLEHN